MVTALINPALRRWECSENIERSVSHPRGLSDPFERGQSGKAIPAFMLVVNAPRLTSTKTQRAPNAEKAASAGFGAGERERERVVAIETLHQKAGRPLPQTL
jgi:hypothetical protein